MTDGTKGQGAAREESRAGDRLLVHAKRIVALWEERLRKEVPAATHEAHPLLIDTLPALLRQLAEALSPLHPRRIATEGSSIAEEHGGERVRLTSFRLEDVIAEYKLLRQVTIEVLEETGPFSAAERSALNSSIDQAIMKACASYTLVQSGIREKLFAIIAHDMRSPLAAAKANAELILRKPSSENVTRWAARTVDSLDRLDRMLQDLLDAMRVQSGAHLPLALEECNLVEIVRQSVELLQAEHGDRFLLVAPEPVRGYFAADALRRAVENLATNAVRYGAPSRPITVTVSLMHERAVIAVHNEGAHIPPEQQPTLFQAFRRAHGESNNKRGWGLGLAQVRGAAEAHGGSITVDSLPDRGTTFTIDIPRDARPFLKNLV